MREYSICLEIEITWESCESGYRKYYWRIKPEQLSLWDRWFNNRWRQLEHAICDNWNPYFSIEDYYELISPLKTVADIKKYYAIETGKIEEVRERFIKSRVVFPDEYDV